MSHIPILLQIRITSIATPVCGSVTDWGILLQMINFPLVTKADIKVAQSHSYSFSYHSNCSQHYAVGPATVALPPTCWHVVTSQLQTPWRSVYFLLTSAGFVKICCIYRIFSSKQLIFPNSVVTWYMWVFAEHLTTLDSNRPISTPGRLTVHL